MLEGCATMSSHLNSILGRTWSRWRSNYHPLVI